jgi:hypothetical protein
MNNKLNEVLDIIPFEEESTENSIITTDKEVERRDIEFSRGNIYSLIQTGQIALDDLVSIAQQSQHPRAFEVVSTLMKTLLDANKDLVDIHKKKKEILNDDETLRTINNNLFVGSTAELQKLLKDAKDS